MRKRQAVFEAPVAESPALEEVIRRLVNAYEPERIYAFIYSDPWLVATPSRTATMTSW